MKQLLLEVCIGCLGLLSCSNTKYVERNGKQFNVPYGTHKRQKMDVFLPEFTDTTKPIVILIHGGSWKRGDKLMLRSVQNMLFKHHVATVNINYRLMRKNKVALKQQQDDIHRSIASADSIFGSHQYALLGESAGAHLAMLYGYGHPEKISKIISLSGPVNLADEAYVSTFKSALAIPLFNRLTNSRFKKGQAIPGSYINQSPLYNISNVPTLLVHGKLDILVSKRQAYAMDSMLTQKNVKHKLVICRYGGHVARLNPLYNKKLIEPAIKEWIGIGN